jgi:penicillin-binding protein 1C
MKIVIKTLLLLLVIMIALSILYVYQSTYVDSEVFKIQDNFVFYDRNGKILRFVPDKRGERHIWIKEEEIPERVKNAFIAGEDSRFYLHPGFDIFAILRAFKDNLFKQRIVSGASTITQQLVRLTYPRKRTYRDKITEVLRSIKLEMVLPKNKIMEYYLNRVPMGNNIVGIELASRVYFGKSCRNISLSEAAVIASLPKAPTRLNPYGKNKKLLLQRKNYVLNRMAEKGFITEKELHEAQNSSPEFQNYSFPFKAPHIVDTLLEQKKSSPPRSYYTTIDCTCQREIEKILSSHKTRLFSRGAHQAAAMVVYNPTMEVIATVGSLSYSSEYGGYNRGQSALRSAGSTLKPFAYGEALETGLTASTVIKDTMKNYRTPSGDYIPYNYDRGQYGPVTLRAALGNSFNISAIKVLEKITIDRFYYLLKRINLINFPDKGPDTYGLGLVIGNAEVSLEQLVSAYAMLANRGLYRPIRYLKDNTTISEPVKIFSQGTAYIISHILSDPSARMITFGQSLDMDFPFRVSLKTGTSTRYRDGWMIGYTPDYTVGVWIGNFKGDSTYGLSGAEGAGPIFKDIMNFLYKNGSPSLLSPPEDVVLVKVCGISGKIPGPFCHYKTEEIFIRGTEPVEFCSFHNKDMHHHLPTSYAAWVSDRDFRGIPDNYRLEAFSHNKKNTFETEIRAAPHKKTKVPIRMKNKSMSPSLVNDDSHNSHENFSHYSIGTEAQTHSRVITDSTITIIYPLEGDRFIFDRNISNQVIELQAVSEKPVEFIDWFVDGMHHARTYPPYYSYWRLKRGKHTIVAASSDLVGDAVKIYVE